MRHYHWHLVVLERCQGTLRVPICTHNADAGCSYVSVFRKLVPAKPSRKLIFSCQLYSMNRWANSLTASLCIIFNLHSLAEDLSSWFVSSVEALSTRIDALRFGLQTIDEAEVRSVLI